MIDVDKILELEAAATPGPWRQGGWVTGASQYAMIGTGANACELGRFHGGFMGDERNSEFTVAMRNSIKDLCLEVKRLREIETKYKELSFAVMIADQLLAELEKNKPEKLDGKND